MTTPTDALWNALTARIESDGALHRSSFDEVVTPFLKQEAAPVQQPEAKPPASPVPFPAWWFTKPPSQEDAIRQARQMMRYEASLRGEVSETPPPAGVFKVGDCVTLPLDRFDASSRGEWMAFARHGHWTVDSTGNQTVTLRRYA